jgi:hypothetical protein
MEKDLFSIFIPWLNIKGKTMLIQKIFLVIIGILAQTAPLLGMMALQEYHAERTAYIIYGVSTIIMGITISALFLIWWIRKTTSGWWAIYVLLVCTNWINWGTSAIHGKEGDDDDNSHGGGGELKALGAHNAINIGLTALFLVFVIFIGWKPKGGTISATGGINPALKSKMVRACITNFGGVDTVRDLASILDVKIDNKPVKMISPDALVLSDVCDKIVFKLANTKTIPEKSRKAIQNILKKVKDNKLIELLNARLVPK